VKQIEVAKRELHDVRNSLEPLVGCAAAGALLVSDASPRLVDVAATDAAIGCVGADEPSFAVARSL
jgi:hypothetical protein